jgi:hypothetical protein
MLDGVREEVVAELVACEHAPNDGGHEGCGGGDESIPGLLVAGAQGAQVAPLSVPVEGVMGLAVDPARAVVRHAVTPITRRWPMWGGSIGRSVSKCFCVTPWKHPATTSAGRGHDSGRPTCHKASACGHKGSFAMKRASVVVLSLIAAGVVVFIELVGFAGRNETPAPSPPLESAARDLPFPPPMPL